MYPWELKTSLKKPPRMSSASRAFKTAAADRCNQNPWDQWESAQARDQHYEVRFSDDRISCKPL